MAQYIVTYHGGRKPESPEEGAEQMKKWQAWLSELGDAVINPGTPLGKTTIVSASGISDVDAVNPMSGYSVLSAENEAAVLDMVQACPFLETGGTLGVSEMMEM
jgi:hypothetical protein